MKLDKIMKLLEQAGWDSALEYECPRCGTGIESDPDVKELYCNECKMIVMQNPLTAMGLI